MAVDMKMYRKGLNAKYKYNQQNLTESTKSTVLSETDPLITSSSPEVSNEQERAAIKPKRGRKKKTNVVIDNVAIINVDNVTNVDNLPTPA